MPSNSDNLFKYSEGGEAFYRWVAHPDPDNEWAQGRNPYPEGSVEHDTWDTGWEDAFQSHFNPPLDLEP